MSQFAVKRNIDIQYAHRVMKHNAACAKLHGHRGCIEVSVVGDLCDEGPETDMVLDFAQIEAALLKLKKMFCHRTLLQRQDPLARILGGPNPQLDLFEMEELPIFLVAGEYADCVLLHFAPTAERLAQLCYEILSVDLNRAGVHVQHVWFWETAKSCAQYPV